MAVPFSIMIHCRPRVILLRRQRGTPISDRSERRTRLGVEARFLSHVFCVTIMIKLCIIVLSNTFEETAWNSFFLAFSDRSERSIRLDVEARFLSLMSSV